MSILKGFNAINGSELAGALESGLTYYQVSEPFPVLIIQLSDELAHI